MSVSEDQPTSDKELPIPPFPPRSKSPPLPPRKNRLGLPPSYVDHLRALLHQWLSQQEAPDDGLPGRKSTERRQLWEGAKLAAVEKAIWEGVVCPSTDSGPGGNGLLKLDWTTWAEGSARRKTAYRKELEAKRNAAQISQQLGTAEESDAGAVRPRHKLIRRRTAEDASSTLRGRKLPSTTTPATPQREPGSRAASRAPSIASVRDASKMPEDPAGPMVVARSKPSKSSESEGDLVETQDHLVRRLKTMKGFHQLDMSKQDGWELLDNDFAGPSERIPPFPGSFPQAGGQYDSMRFTKSKATGNKTVNVLPPIPTASKASAPTVLKTVFCLHVPPTDHLHRSNTNASTSTLRRRRDSSVGARSQESLGSTSGRGWFSGGSLLRGSDMTVGPSAFDGNLHLEFVEGRFALPHPHQNFSYPESARGSRRSRQRRNIPEQPDASDDGASAEVDAVENALEDTSSVWSGTQREHSALLSPRGFNSILVGKEDDIPLVDDQCRDIGIVGGTIISRGLSREEDQKALGDILTLLIYTISSMTLELELFDALRIPRETDPPPEAQRSHTDHQPRSKSPSTGPQRSKSSRDRQGPRSFLRRLGKGDILGGLLGRRRESVEGDTVLFGTAIVANPSRSLSETSAAAPQHTGSVLNASPNLFLLGTPNPNSVDRHLAVLETMETLRLSTTPGLRVPMPSLLLKMREQQKFRLNKAQQELRNESLPQNEGLPMRAESTLPEAGSNGRDIMRGRALGHRLGGDVRAGLGALPPWLDDFEGWSKLQRLDVLSCTGTHEQEPVETGAYILCSEPKQTTLRFWDVHGDKTLSELINEAQEDDDDVVGCTRAGCGILPREHVRWWLHGNQRITMKIHQNPSEDDASELDVWVKCRACSAQSQARPLSILAAQFSLGKFFELFLYSDRVRQSVLCQHDDKQGITIFLRSKCRVLSFSLDDVEILDTRLPKLQVGPNVAKRKGGIDAAQTIIDSLQRSDAKETLLQGLQTEAAAFYASVESRIAIFQEKCASGVSGEKKDQEKNSVATSGETSVELPQDSKELDEMEAALAQAKAICNEQLATLSSGTLNDGRQRLIDDVCKFSGQLGAWTKKYAKDLEDGLAPLAIPEYSGSKVHALPGSAVLVREEEPSSLIAYTLSCVSREGVFPELMSSSLSYFTELAAQSPSSGEEATVKTKYQVSSAGDRWIVEIKRRDSPRDLLSLRTISKKRSEVSVAPSSLKTPMSLTTTAPVLEVSKEHGEGHAQQRENLTDLVKSISKATANDPVLTMKARSPSMSMSENESSPAPSRTTTPAPPKIEAVGRIASDSSPRTHRGAMAESAPPSAFRSTRVPPSAISTPITAQSGFTQTSTANAIGKDGWTSSVTSSFANSFTHLMKLGSDVTEAMGSVSQKMRGGERSLSSLIGPLNMMSNMDNSLSTFDDKPHIQFTYTLGDKLKLGCTVYYATAFDSLRRRCAIDKSIINSLARSETWIAEGGKSKACFFKTRDGKYIVKELVSKWNVSDTQALLEISPAYFEHLASTHNKATSLAKIVGFYTVRFQDLQTSTKKQLDLLVMENLFYKQNIEKTYDLKGIEGRKLTKTQGPGTTLWDAEWLEKQHTDPILLYPHAKRALLEAISNDTRFLSSQSIIDYSLLLGLDSSKSELVVGVVDAIGSYNLFKTIESRGKQALNRGGDVTIIPPEQYRERFETALRQYFLVCPDKWSRPRCKLSPTLPSPL